MAICNDLPPIALSTCIRGGSLLSRRNVMPFKLFLTSQAATTGTGSDRAGIFLKTCLKKSGKPTRIERQLVLNFSSERGVFQDGHEQQAGRRQTGPIGRQTSRWQTDSHCQQIQSRPQDIRGTAQTGGLQTAKEGIKPRNSILPSGQNPVLACAPVQKTGVFLFYGNGFNRRHGDKYGVTPRGIPCIFC